MIHSLCSLLSRELHFTFLAPSILLGMQKSQLLYFRFSPWHRQDFRSETLFEHLHLSVVPQGPKFLDPSYLGVLKHFTPCHANFLGRKLAMTQELKQA